jgi:hypothetical protein
MARCYVYSPLRRDVCRRFDRDLDPNVKMPAGAGSTATHLRLQQNGNEVTGSRLWSAGTRLPGGIAATSAGQADAWGKSWVTTTQARERRVFEDPVASRPPKAWCKNSGSYTFRGHGFATGDSRYEFAPPPLVTLVKPGRV